MVARRGRPPLSDPRTERTTTRWTAGEMAGILRATRGAKAEDISAWMRAVVLEAVRQHEIRVAFSDPADEVPLADDDPTEEDEAPCQGHPAGPNDPMGITVYCDGSCRG